MLIIHNTGAGMPPLWRSGGAPPAGYAVVGDGAGGYNFEVRSVVSGAITETVALAWPSAVSDWVRLSFRMRSATSARNAQFSLALNEVVTITRDLGAADQPVAGPTNQFSWRPMMHNTSTVAVDFIHIADRFIMWGEESILGAGLFTG